MTKLRREARGQECQIRLPGICNFDPATTVLAHYRLIGLSGMGYKADDEIAAYACSACHDAVDRRSHMDLERDFVKLAHAEGVLRTIAGRKADKSNGGW
jgi:hypothetical protein